MSRQKYKLQTGDRIIVPVSTLNLAQHYAIFLGMDKNRVQWVIENDFHAGVQLKT